MSNPQQQTRWIVFLPIFMALSVIFGIFIGQQINTKGRGGFLFASEPDENQKLYEILQLIDEKYVDTIDKSMLVEAAIEAIMTKLDPHSAYLPPIEQSSAAEELEGNFEGIGIEFNIINDTIAVVRTISGGPSEKEGIRPGDRIIQIDGKTVAGTGITNNDVLKNLRGNAGTEVKLTLLRKGSAKFIEMTIVRDVIPIYSVDASFMINSDIGYIRVNKFSQTTLSEYSDAFSNLKRKGMKRLILDLRDNPGGLLDVAISLADDYLPKGRLIVYTEDRNKNRKEFYATKGGNFESGDLIVLVDEGSASASEIVSGALQDNDRAVIIGRRTFGKGLVQEPIELGDGSAIRLTISRYYTPAGRSIQKSYEEGIEKYYENALQMYDPAKDSMYKDDAHQYKTLAGRIVYGGGGILPDIIVPYDTSGFSMLLLDALNSGYVNDFAFEYADEKRNSLAQTYKSYVAYGDNTEIDETLLQDFIAYLRKKGVSVNTIEVKISQNELISRIKPLVARNLWKNEGYFYVLSKYDPMLKSALEEFGN